MRPAPASSLANEDHDQPTPRSSAQVRTRQAIALFVATVAFGAALYTRRTGNVWLGVGIASTAALGTTLVVGALPKLQHRGMGIVRELGLGAALGLAMALATHAIVPFALELVPGAEAQVRSLYQNLQHVPGPVAALPVLALAVIAEEVVWRGVAIELLDRRVDLAIFGAALCYALPQILSGSWLLFVLALVCGVAWGALRAWRKSLLAPMATHFVWNLVVFVFWPLGPGVPSPL